MKKMIILLSTFFLNVYSQILISDKAENQKQSKKNSKDVLYEIRKNIGKKNVSKSDLQDALRKIKDFEEITNPPYYKKERAALALEIAKNTSDVIVKSEAVKNLTFGLDESLRSDQYQQFVKLLAPSFVSSKLIKMYSNEQAEILNLKKGPERGFKEHLRKEQNLIQQMDVIQEYIIQKLPLRDPKAAMISISELTLVPAAYFKSIFKICSLTINLDKDGKYQEKQKLFSLCHSKKNYEKWEKIAGKNVELRKAVADIKGLKEKYFFQEKIKNIYGEALTNLKEREGKVIENCNLEGISPALRNELFDKIIECGLEKTFPEIVKKKLDSINDQRRAMEKINGQIQSAKERARVKTD